MTVSSPVSRIVHLTHGAVSDYTFPFKVFKAAKLAVDLVDASFRVRRLELGVDFTVTGLGLDQGGTVVLTSAGIEKAGSGLSLVMLRRMDFTQETDYRPHDVFPAETHERALDILTMICQELREMVGRALIAPPNLDKPIQYSDLVALMERAEAARDAAQAEADRAEAAAGNAAEDVRGELAGMVAAAETAQSQAEKAKTQARGAATMAKNQAALARRWAANPEDEEVKDGLFSARHYAARAAQSAQSLDMPDLNEAQAGQVLTAVEREGQSPRLEYAAPRSPYELGEVYHFRSPILRPGFQPAQGGLLSLVGGRPVAEVYPEAWAYLQTPEGQRLCKTEAEWQALSAAAPWNGLGGVPWFVIDLMAGTLRLPDLRGMYFEAAGFDGLDVGGTRKDRIVNITADYLFGPNYGPLIRDSITTGAFKIGRQVNGSEWYDRPGSAGYALDFDASNVVETGASVAPRAWGVLACIYLGQPQGV